MDLPSWAYDPENFNPKPPQELKCIICSLVLRDPVQSPCNHLYCRSCIYQWLEVSSTCPICRSDLTLQTVVNAMPVIRSLVMGLHLRCSQCREMTTLENCCNHLKECGRVVKDSKKKKVLPKRHSKKKKGTANAEPQIIDTETELSDEVLKQCKEQMRPVKRHLMKLSQKDEDVTTAEEKYQRFAQKLLRVGRKVSEILKGYSDPVKVEEWRSNLWIFVAKFTGLNAKQLYKIYRQAIKDIELYNHPSSVCNV